MKNSNGKEVKINGFTKEEAKQIYNQYRETERFLELKEGLYLAGFPLSVHLTTFTTIYVHPDYLTVIKFPFEIVSAESSASVKHFLIRDNVLEIQANPNISDFNALVYYKDEDGNIRLATILFKLINPFKSKDVNNTVLFTHISLVRNPIAKPEDVLEAYRRIYGVFPEKTTTFFNYNGNIYRITRSTKYGQIRAGKYNYFISLSKSGD